MPVIGSSSIGLASPKVGPGGPTGSTGPTGPMGSTGGLRGGTGPTGATGIYVSSSYSSDNNETLYVTLSDGSTIKIQTDTLRGPTGNNGNADGQNLGSGVGIFKSIDGTTFWFKGISADGSLSIVETENTIRIDDVFSPTDGSISGGIDGRFAYLSARNVIGGSGLTFDDGTIIFGHGHTGGRFSLDAEDRIINVSPVERDELVGIYGQPCDENPSACVGRKIGQGIQLAVTAGSIFDVQCPIGIAGFTGNFRSGELINFTMILRDNDVWDFPSNVKLDEKYFSCGTDIINIMSKDAGQNWSATITVRGYGTKECSSVFGIGSCCYITDEDNLECKELISREACENLNRSRWNPLSSCADSCGVTAEGICCSSGSNEGSIEDGLCLTNLGQKECNQFFSHFYETFNYIERDPSNGDYRMVPLETPLPITCGGPLPCWLFDDFDTDSRCISNRGTLLGQSELTNELCSPVCSTNCFACCKDGSCIGDHSGTGVGPLSPAICRYVYGGTPIATSRDPGATGGECADCGNTDCCGAELYYGACCYPERILYDEDETTIIGIEYSHCEYSDYISCTTISPLGGTGPGVGIFLGPETTCDNSNEICCFSESEYGACCKNNGECSITSVHDCSLNTGLFMGIGTYCGYDICGEGTEDAGACCTSGILGDPLNPVCHDSLSAVECANMGGLFYTNTICPGDNSLCLDTIPPTGACCRENVPPGVPSCIVITESQCLGTNGVWHGEQHATCTQNPCSGTCCCTPPSGEPACSDSESNEMCESAGTCCCYDFDEGTYSCQNVPGEGDWDQTTCELASECEFHSGKTCGDADQCEGGNLDCQFYLGNSCGDTNPCNIGACCCPSSECEDTQESACDDLCVWHPNESCSDDPCVEVVVGACCWCCMGEQDEPLHCDDSENWNCDELTSAHCAGTGYMVCPDDELPQIPGQDNPEYHGDGSLCEDITDGCYSMPRGSCCVGMPNTAIACNNDVTEYQCENYTGAEYTFWAGPNSTCPDSDGDEYFEYTMSNFCSSGEIAPCLHRHEYLVGGGTKTRYTYFCFNGTAYDCFNMSVELVDVNNWHHFADNWSPYTGAYCKHLYCGFEEVLLGDSPSNWALWFGGTAPNEPTGVSHIYAGYPDTSSGTCCCWVDDDPIPTCAEHTDSGLVCSTTEDCWWNAGKVCGQDDSCTGGVADDNDYMRHCYYDCDCVHMYEETDPTPSYPGPYVSCRIDNNIGKGGCLGGLLRGGTPIFEDSHFPPPAVPHPEIFLPSYGPVVRNPRGEICCADEGLDGQLTFSNEFCIGGACCCPNSECEDTLESACDDLCVWHPNESCSDEPCVLGGECEVDGDCTVGEPGDIGYMSCECPTDGTDQECCCNSGVCCYPEDLSCTCATGSCVGDDDCCGDAMCCGGACCGGEDAECCFGECCGNEIIPDFGTCCCCYSNDYEECIDGLTEEECYEEGPEYQYNTGKTCADPDDRCGGGVIRPSHCCGTAEVCCPGNTACCGLSCCSPGYCCAPDAPGGNLTCCPCSCIVEQGYCDADAETENCGCGCEPMFGVGCVGECTCDDFGSCTEGTGKMMAIPIIGEENRNGEDYGSPRHIRRCPADINNDGVVNVHDILLVIDSWGQEGGPADITGDGIVGVRDLLEVISALGPCPEYETEFLTPGPGCDPDEPECFVYSNPDYNVFAWPRMFGHQISGSLVRYPEEGGLGGLGGITTGSRLSIIAPHKIGDIRYGYDGALTGTSYFYVYRLNEDEQWVQEQIEYVLPVDPYPGGPLYGKWGHKTAYPPWNDQTGSFYFGTLGDISISNDTLVLGMGQPPTTSVTDVWPLTEYIPQCGEGGEEPNPPHDQLTTGYVLNFNNNSQVWDVAARLVTPCDNNIVPPFEQSGTCGSNFYPDGNNFRGLTISSRVHVDSEKIVLGSAFHSDRNRLINCDNGGCESRPWFPGGVFVYEYDHVNNVWGLPVEECMDFEHSPSGPVYYTLPNYRLPGPSNWDEYEHNNTDEYFGSDIAIDGDRILASSSPHGFGAWGGTDQSVTSRSEFVYLYEKVAGEWEETQIFNNPQGLSGDAFGGLWDWAGVGAGSWSSYWSLGSYYNSNSLAIYGNLIAIGAPYDRTNRGEGTVSVFRNSDGRSGWNLEYVIKPGEYLPAGRFGWSVSILDENNIAIGAETQDIDGKPTQGGVHVFSYREGPGGPRWLPTKTIKSYDGDSDDRFGQGMYGSGDFLAVGAPGHYQHADNFDVDNILHYEPTALGNLSEQSKRYFGAVYLYKPYDDRSARGGRENPDSVGSWQTALNMAKTKSPKAADIILKEMNKRFGDKGKTTAYTSLSFVKLPDGVCVWMVCDSGECPYPECDSTYRYEMRNIL